MRCVGAHGTQRCVREFVRALRGVVDSSWVVDAPAGMLWYEFPPC